MKKKLVFTYGTLMKGERNHYLLLDEDFVSDATCKGFKIFNLGTYPGIVAGNGTICGELYSVDDETLKRLDSLEEEGALYIRNKIVINTPQQEFEAFVYIYNLNIPNSCFDHGCYKWKNNQIVAIKIWIHGFD